jgi:hypothetical protein
MKKKILVLYLCTQFVSKKKFLKFLKFYNKYNAGISHRLLICFKNFNINDLIFYRRKLKDLKKLKDQKKLKVKNKIFYDLSKNCNASLHAICSAFRLILCCPSPIKINTLPFSNT